MRWSFLKKQAIPVVKFLPEKKLRQTEEDSMSISDSQADTTISTPESDDMKCSVSQKTTVENSNPPSRIMSRQTSRSSLVSSNKLQVPSNSRSSNPGSPNKLKNSKSEPENLKASNINGMLQRFLEFENRHFVLQQRFISMSKEVGTLDQNTTDFKAVTPNIRGFRSQNRKIGFFTSPESLINHSSSSSSTTDGSSSEDNMEEDNRTLFPSLSRSPRMKNKKDYYNNRCVPSPSLASTTSAITSSPSYNAISPSISDTDIGTGRTSEQGRDYLIELDGDLLAVYGYQSLKFLDRPWNKNRAAKATTVQFNFVSFDELIPYLAKFRITFPNVIHFRFVETGLHCLGQLNALSGLQGITSLQIEEDGNPIILKSEWKLYAIYRFRTLGTTDHQ
ncbi:LRRC49 [Lepeophtheirus salmonis]|uniref:LRRC49 n=1 Tax=Lepeophtheirus salmonis TaxID=72036 RepID=A0A7R8D555_LEPSM|nr:LRRC49 [Lepeophtheirus salmonis]CAF3031522.1 LRRC49 [Lepeophtheirus salmonis]